MTMAATPVNGKMSHAAMSSLGARAVVAPAGHEQAAAERVLASAVSSSCDVGMALQTLLAQEGGEGDNMCPPPKRTLAVPSLSLFGTDPSVRSAAGQESQRAAQQLATLNLGHPSTFRNEAVQDAPLHMTLNLSTSFVHLVQANARRYFQCHAVQRLSENAGGLPSNLDAGALRLVKEQARTFTDGLISEVGVLRFASGQCRTMNARPRHPEGAVVEFSSFETSFAYKKDVENGNRHVPITMTFRIEAVVDGIPQSLTATADGRFTGSDEVAALSLDIPELLASLRKAARSLVGAAVTSNIAVGRLNQLESQLSRAPQPIGPSRFAGPRLPPRGLWLGKFHIVTPPTSPRPHRMLLRTILDRSEARSRDESSSEPPTKKRRISMDENDPSTSKDFDNRVALTNALNKALGIMNVDARTS